MGFFKPPKISLPGGGPGGNSPGSVGKVKGGKTYRGFIKIENWNPDAIQSAHDPSQYTHVRTNVRLSTGNTVADALAGGDNLGVHPGEFQKIERDGQELSFRFRVPKATPPGRKIFIGFSFSDGSRMPDAEDHVFLDIDADWSIGGESNA